jgi:hypothetical protein
MLTNESRILLFGRIYHVNTINRRDSVQRQLEFDTPFFKVTMIKYMNNLDGGPNQLDKINVTLEIPEEMANAEANA